MLKKELREDYKKLRKSISDEFLLDSGLSIANSTLELPIWHHQHFHVFLPISKQREVYTDFLVALLKKKNKCTIVPKVHDNYTLKHHLLTDTTEFKVNRWNIPEPVDGLEISSEKIDVVFLPLLAFDRRGQRVGYGKGFYDRFLSECRKDVVKVGLSMFEAEEFIEDVEENDIPMDYCVTPERIYSFSSGSGEF